MEKCLFCSIAAGEVNADVIFKNEKFMVLKDINPQAPVHLLVIPVVHHENVLDAASVNPDLLAVLLSECAILGQKLGGADGFRIVVNTGPYGGQTVNHLHFHVLAGRELQWPPG